MNKKVQVLKYPDRTVMSVTLGFLRDNLSETLIESAFEAGMITVDEEFEQRAKELQQIGRFNQEKYGMDGSIFDRIKKELEKNGPGETIRGVIE